MLEAKIQNIKPYIRDYIKRGLDIILVPSSLIRFVRLVDTNQGYENEGSKRVAYIAAIFLETQRVYGYYKLTEFLLTN